MEVVEHQVFRVTRNADLEVEEDRDEDLLQALERELARRRFGPPVRLEVTDTTSERVLDLLLERARRRPDEDVLRSARAARPRLAVAALRAGPAGRSRTRRSCRRPIRAFAEGETPKSVFATLREGDVLVHHPYESFATSVQRFIEQAAADPRVLAIKQTLYRTSGDSPIVDALIDAAEAGKQVVALVEIKARFDEQANITWAKALERAGCHVVYGLVGLKTHCKTALVVRQEGRPLRRYCHLGTGNYNPKTARIYEDLGLFTADPDIGADLTDLFNVLTGYSRQTEYRTLLVAPHAIRSGIVERIEREIEHAAGRPGRPGPAEDELTSSTRRSSTRSTGPRRPACEVDLLVADDLRAPRRRARPVREHHGPLDRRPLPGALAGSSTSANDGEPGVLDRQRRHDAPQPRPPGGGPGPGQGQGGPRAPARHRSDARLRRRPVAGNCGPDGLDPQPRTAGHAAAGQPGSAHAPARRAVAE